MTYQEISVSDPQVNATTDNSAILSGTTAAGTSEQPAAAGETATDVALSGVSTTVAGDLSSVATAAAAGLPTEAFTEAVGAYVDKLHSAESEAQATTVDVLGDLDAIEKQALFMGGEVGVDIRNRVCRIRLALTGQSHTEA
jgi:hypothetical protein